MRQIVVIHGGNTFETYDSYIEYLRNQKVENIDYFKPIPNWKTSLQTELGEDFEVLLPKMPNKQNAKYLEWKIWFEKIIPFLKDGVILIGHSLGASFITRYLSENEFHVRVAATFLVSGAYSTDMGEMAEEFAAPASLALFANQGGTIFLYHSEDDPVVPFSELAKYQTALPNATVRVFSNRQHFNQESFPELVVDIKSLM